MKKTTNNLKNIILEDDVVQLRPLVYEDLEQLVSFAEKEPDIWTFSLVPLTGAGDMKEYIESALSAKDANTEYPFIVFDKRSGRYAGSTRFYDIQLDKGTLQLGYTWYGKDFQGSGLNKHCKFLLLNYAFDFLGVERVEFRADTNNLKSVAAMKSIGCTVEGVLRSHLPMPKGGRRDTIILSILRSEWNEKLKMELRGKLVTA